ncbi:unnamed protein product [Eruca vesicaria subsp. sativa]|uniref:Uncharacterized protein n=1 Tax=Eruca vesicaria subsp. sativa TaxID=29727 RepID=A0ABC8KKJ1_ERUVS|nr:unnamed protein product [Eruca vesicaria subsp. sativa]
MLHVTPYSGGRLLATMMFRSQKEALTFKIYGDPDAAVVEFMSGDDITVVGINITTQLKLTGVFGWGLRLRPQAHLLMDQALKRSYSINFTLHMKRKNCRWRWRWSWSNPWVRF